MNGPGRAIVAGVAQHSRASDAVYEALRNRILDSSLLPGQRIETSGISAEMGTSRMPVKQALDRLAAEGLLDILPNRGTFVARPSLKRTSEAFEIRIALELIAAERILSRITPERIRALEDALTTLERLPDDDGVIAHMLENERFHTLLVEFSANDTLLLMYRQLRAHIHMAQIHTRSPGWRTRREQEQREHRAIFDAIVSSDEVELVSTLRAHLERAHRSLLDDIGRDGDGEGAFPSPPKRTPRAAKSGPQGRVSIGDHQIAYWQEGTGAEIVLLHGFACSSEDWAATARRLSDRYRVTRLDFPAHGCTTGPQVNAINQLVQSTRRALATLCHQSPVIVGHSMGGMVALALALADSQTMPGLILVDSFPHLASVAETFGGSDDPSDPFGYGSVIDESTPPHVQYFVRAEMQAGATRAGSVLFDSLLAFDARDQMHVLRVPTHAIIGNRRWVDSTTLPRVLERLGLAAIPNLETTLVDSHHFVMLEQPEETSGQIAAFVESLNEKLVP